jgi:hypothetical protein
MSYVQYFFMSKFLPKDVLFWLFYQMFRYIGLFWGSMQVYSGRHVVNIDLHPLSLKSDRKEGGFRGLKFKILNLYIFTKDTSTQTILIHRYKIYTYVSIPPPPSRNRSQYEMNAVCRCPFYIATRIRVKANTCVLCNKNKSKSE